MRLSPGMFRECLRRRRRRSLRAVLPPEPNLLDQTARLARGQSGRSGCRCRAEAHPPATLRPTTGSCRSPDVPCAHPSHRDRLRPGDLADPLLEPGCAARWQRWPSCRESCARGLPVIGATSSASRSTSPFLNVQTHRAPLASSPRRPASGVSGPPDPVPTPQADCETASPGSPFPGFRIECLVHPRTRSRNCRARRDAEGRVTGAGTGDRARATTRRAGSPAPRKVAPRA
jgi:hypothetical protein